MMSFLNNLPLVKDLANLVEILLVLNILLMGIIILLGYRLSASRARIQQLESEINETIGETISDASPDQPVIHRRTRR